MGERINGWINETSPNRFDYCMCFRAVFVTYIVYKDGCLPIARTLPVLLPQGGIYFPASTRGLWPGRVGSKRPCSFARRQHLKKPVEPTGGWEAMWRGPEAQLPASTHCQPCERSQNPPAWPALLMNAATGVRPGEGMRGTTQPT